MLGIAHGVGGGARQQARDMRKEESRVAYRMAFRNRGLSWAVSADGAMGFLV